MFLRHLGLAVGDQERSLRFYATYFAFDRATASRYPDGTIIVRDRHGFDLALHEIAKHGPAPTSAPPFLHFGFSCESPDRVRELHDRLAADGYRIVEYDDEPGMVSFKCLDPDGYRVEVYWEPRA
ncbi:hypothetical protein GCM10023322_37510 [Rugosimonospora acidiphila]|uniref:VOC domain-containing protein n=1 Tax=Rugosimonospora acidiphila TaxID=556531 RepID=A0ABP9RXL8_9ACTN